MLFLNCPAIGVMSAARTSFVLNYITNTLADHPLNSVCVIVHPNRAGQQEGRRDIIKRKHSIAQVGIDIIFIDSSIKKPIVKYH